MVLIATSSFEQHGNEQRAGHPPAPAPDPLGIRRKSTWENQKKFQVHGAKFFVSS